MEPSSKLYGDRTEECQSSESGWTMYIGSSMDDDDDDEDVGGGGKNKYKDNSVKDEDEDEDTDDSMTSDASSGPSHLQLQQAGESDGKHNQESYKCLSKKNKKVASRKKKVGYEEESRKKEDSLVNEKKCVITTVQSGNRAWFLGKKK